MQGDSGYTLREWESRLIYPTIDIQQIRCIDIQSTCIQCIHVDPGNGLLVNPMKAFFSCNLWQTSLIGSKKIDSHCFMRSHLNSYSSLSQFLCGGVLTLFNECTKIVFNMAKIIFSSSKRYIVIDPVCYNVSAKISFSWRFRTLFFSVTIVKNNAKLTIHEIEM